MTNARGHILPFFIPHAGCPQQCIFCNQKTISGISQQPTAEEILKNMEDNKDRNCQLAFYGGSFTAMPKDRQLYYLETANIGLSNHWINSIRISTRPDCINQEVIDRLKKYHVETVELGVQSLNDKTLRISKRGHSAADSFNAVKMLKNAGFIVGVQLMPGLPEDDYTSIINGAEKILSLKPDLLRIYPTVVVAETEMATMYQQKRYTPLSLEQAVEISAIITILADKYDVKVIRTGLNTDDNLAAEVLAGPYHPAFGNLVKSYIWRQKILWAIKDFADKHKINDLQAVYAAKNKLPMIFGQQGINKKYYAEKFAGNKVKIKSFNDIIGDDEENIILYDKNQNTYLYNNEQFKRDYLNKIFKQIDNTCC